MKIAQFSLNKKKISRRHWFFFFIIFLIAFAFGREKDEKYQQRQQIMMGEWRGGYMGSYFNQQSDRKKSVKKKNFKKVTPTKHDERKKKKRKIKCSEGVENIFFRFALFSSLHWFNFLRSMFKEGFHWGLHASLYIHPRVAAMVKKTVCCESRFSLNINSGLKWNEIIGGFKKKVQGRHFMLKLNLIPK